MARDLGEWLRFAVGQVATDLDVDRLRRRAQTLRRRRWATVAVLVATSVLPIVVLVVALVPGLAVPWRVVSGPSVSTSTGPASTTTAHTAPAGPFIPPARRAGDRALLPVTFPDGTTAEIVSPVELDLAGMGVRPYGAVSYPGCCDRDYLALREGYAPLVVASEPVARYQGADGRPVLLWPGGDWAKHALEFSFGRWRVLFWDGAGGSEMTEEQRATWARHLRARVTPSGFLVLEPTPPLRLAAPGELGAPALEFGDVAAKGVTVSLAPCQRDAVDRTTQADGSMTASVCRKAWSMALQVQGDRAFVEAVVDRLDVREVRPAGKGG